MSGRKRLISKVLNAKSFAKRFERKKANKKIKSTFSHCSFISLVFRQNLGIQFFKTRLDFQNNIGFLKQDWFFKTRLDFQNKIGFTKIKPFLIFVFSAMSSCYHVSICYQSTTAPKLLPNNT